jgi:hypothetical protein
MSVKFTVNDIHHIQDRPVAEAAITLALEELGGNYSVEIHEYITDQIYMVRISGTNNGMFYFTKRGVPIAEQIRRSLKATVGRSRLN